MSNGEEMHILEIHKPGVYAIHNKRNGKYYIGSTNDLCNRTKTHRQNLYNGRINSRMAQDLASGKRQKDFEFIALKVFENGEVTESYLRNQEAYFIKKYKADSDGYNDPSHEPMPHPKNGNNFVFAPQEFDRISVNLPKGTKEKIKELTGKSCNAYISELVLADIKRLENKPPQDASGAETVSEIVKSAPAAEAPQNVDLQALCAVYSKDTILSVAGQLEIFQRYGEEVMNKLVKYARAEEH